MAGTKVDFKRELRELYSAKRDATFVEVPELQFAMVDGHGDPNEAPEYAEAVQALFSVSYTARFALKRAPDGLDYGVMPLEGLWWAQDMSAFTTGDKSSWDWTMMIMQPEQVTPEVFDDARARGHEEEAAAGHRAAAARALQRGAFGTAAPRRALRNRGPDDPAAARVHRRPWLRARRQAPRDLPERSLAHGAREAQDDHPPARPPELKARCWTTRSAEGRAEEQGHRQSTVTWWS